MGNISDIKATWEELSKALNHAAAIQKVTMPEAKEEEVLPHPDHMEKVKYGFRNIPGTDDVMGSDRKNIGYTKVGGKGYVVRHGAAAHRTDTEHQMAKLLGADHMVPEQHYDHGVNHHDHHGEDSYDAHQHGGTSFQEHSDGKSLYANDKAATEKLRDQWKNGDLHKLWALHYISNNADMHAGNFNIGKDGIKAFDSDHAFHELPTGHVVERDHEPGNNEARIKYMPYSQSQIPSYLNKFIDHPNDEEIEPTHKDDQVSVKSLNEHAGKINPELFEQFGPHAAERAMKAKKALASSDPTGEMMKLWNDHSDKTGDLTWDKNPSLKAKSKDQKATKGDSQP